jgi:hypothetical protein
MAGLNDNDLKRIDARIAAATTLLDEKFAAAIAQLKFKGWKRAANVLLESATNALVIGVFLALLAIAVGALYQSFAHIKEETQFRTRTEDKLNEIEKSLARLGAANERGRPGFGQRLPVLLEDNAVVQGSALRLQTVAALAEGAREDHVIIPESVVAHVGKLVIDANHSSDPLVRSAAWSANRSLLDYVSALREGSGPDPKTAEPLPQQWSALIDWGFEESGEGEIAVGFIGEAPSNQCARGEHIGEPQRGFTSGGGPAWVIVKNSHSGKTLRLDGHFLKNIVYSGLRIAYRGGPMKLENVYFVNCTFDIVENERGKRFSEAVFASPATALSL